MATSVLRVNILGNAKNFRSALGDAESGVKGFGGSLKGMAAAVGGAFAVTKVVDFGAKIIGSASDLNETISKSNTVFGESGKAIEEWANGAATALGQSKQEALNAASTFGNLFVQLGTGQSEAAGMSRQMVELASDFASFHNAAPTDVIEAMTAAFRGEYDAVQRYVPTINAAAVEQKALAMTGKKATKELTAQEKAIATQTLLMEGAGDAMGDFGRTADGAANRQRILSAQIKDAQAKLGNLLLPAYQKVLGFITTTVLPGLEKLGRFVGDNKEIFIAVAGVIATVVVAAFVQWAIAAGAAAVATLAAMAPIIAITAAIAALVAGVIYAYQNWDWFRAAVDKVAAFFKDKLLPALKTVGDWIVNSLVPAVGSIMGKFGEWIGKAVEVASTIKSKFDEVVSFVTGLPGRIATAASGMWNGIKDSFRSAINWIIRGWNGLQFKIPGFDPPGPGPKFGGFTLGLPDVPLLARGGTITQAGAAIVGDAGPELLELPTGARVTPLDRAGGTAITINLHGTASRMDGQAVVDALVEHQRRNGALPLSVRTVQR